MGTKKNSRSSSYHPFKSKEAKIKYLKYYDAKSIKWPVPFDSKLISTRYGSTYVRVSGPEDGATMVLIPGDTENSLSWARNIKKLSENYRVFAPDPIFDFGRSVSSRPLRKPNDFVKWLNELFTNLGLSNINLVSYSYGAWYSTLYAISHPEKLNKLVIISPSNTVLSGRFKAIFRAVVQYFFSTRKVIKDYIYWSYDNVVKCSEETRKVIDEMIEELLLCNASFERKKFVPPTVLKKDDWENLQIPTLFIVGENEYIYSAKKAIRHLNTVKPELKTIMIPNTGHGLMILETERINKEILDFFGRYN
ncbi:alpha/beta fold hydrolase [Flagellimonas sp.]|uniref:alpha/beta fold hydrolase n=1 Tax=Flagellimonas sp. TaxID=2058762 RepID=UPI003F49CF4C